MTNFTTYESGGMKDNLGKPRMSLLPPEVLKGVLEVFEYGSNKYDDFNWCRGLPYMALCDAAVRHLILKWSQGEDFDDESGLHHLDHAIANLIMIRHYTRNKEDYGHLDNRFFVGGD